MPFAGLCFLWFIGVVRANLGRYEDRFFATVTLGSGLLFLAMMFASAAVGAGLASASHYGGSGAGTVFGQMLLLKLSKTYALKMAAVFMMSNPVLLAAGALFGGMHVFDERKRKMQARRQAARTQMRQFVDDVQFAVGNELTNQLRSVQRGLRDEFSDLIGELQRTWSDTAKRTEEARRATADQIATRRAELERAAEQLSSLRRELEPAR
jgi:hypothetical protein